MPHHTVATSVLHIHSMVRDSKVFSFIFPQRHLLTIVFIVSTSLQVIHDSFAIKPVRIISLATPHCIHHPHGFLNKLRVFAGFPERWKATMIHRNHCKQRIEHAELKLKLVLQGNVKKGGGIINSIEGQSLKLRRLYLVPLKPRSCRIETFMKPWRKTSLRSGISAFSIECCEF